MKGFTGFRVSWCRVWLLGFGASRILCNFLSRLSMSRWLPIGYIVLHFCGLYLGSYKVSPQKRNSNGAYGYFLLHDTDYLPLFSYFVVEV